MDNKQYRDSMKLVVWSMIGMLLMFIALALSSCKSAKESVYERVDSVYIERLIPYELPADSAAIHALLECNEEGEVVLQKLNLVNTKNVQLRFALDSIGNLKTGMKVEHDTLYLPATEKLMYTDKVVTEFLEVEKQLNWWMRLRVWLGNLTLISIAGWLLWKVLKMKFRLAIN